jgi:hypothetical protein
MTKSTFSPAGGKGNIVLVMLILVLVSLAGVRLWLEKEASAVPYPYWLAVSDNGIAIIYGDTIYLCDAEGTISKRITIPDHIVPCQLSWHNDKLIVADWKNDELHLFGSYGMTSIQLRGGPNINAHLNAILDEKNNAIYVTDSDGSRIHKYDSQGSYGESFGRFGFGQGSLSSPKDMRLLNDTLYVGNVMRSGVDAFSTDGKFIKSIVEPKGNILYNLITDFDIADDYVVTIECDVLFAHCLIASYNWEGKLLSKIPQAAGSGSVGDVAMKGDIVYVSDAANRRITKYDVATLEILGPVSLELNAIGESDNSKYEALKSYSRYSLIAGRVIVLAVQEITAIACRAHCSRRSTGAQCRLRELYPWSYHSPRRALYGKKDDQITTR